MVRCGPLFNNLESVQYLQMELQAPMKASKKIVSDEKRRKETRK